MKWVETAKGPTEPGAHYEGEPVVGQVWVPDYYPSGESFWWNVVPGHYEDQIIGYWHWVPPVTCDAVSLRTIRTITAATRNRLPVDFQLDIPAGKKGKYDISVSRLTADRSDLSVIDKVSYLGHTETHFEPYSYPRHVLVGIRALLTDQISGSFKFSCLARGAHVHVYHPETQVWTVEWSCNQAWVAYDILTSPVFYDNKIGTSSASQADAVARYDGISPARIDLASVLEFAAFCNALLSDGHGQSIVTVGEALQKYKCIAPHQAIERLKPGVEYYIDKIAAMTSPTLEGVCTVTTNAADQEFIGNNGGIDYYRDANPGWRAFDHLNTYWHPIMQGNPAEAWLQVAFNLPTRIRKIGMRWIKTDGQPATTVSYVYEGHDGVNWNALVTKENVDVSSAIYEQIFVNDTAYNTYRLRVTANADDLVLRELFLYDQDETWQSYWEMVADGTASVWMPGMRYYAGTEPRYTFNGGFDQRTSRWDAIIQVCATAQAAPVIVGTKIYFIVDTIKVPSQLITEGNATSFTEKFLNLANRATEIDATFKNAEKDYESDRIIAFHSNSALNYGKADVKTMGLTKASEVWRLAKHTVMQNQKRRVCEVGMDIDSIACMVGDVVYLQSEVPDWENSRGGNVLGATDTTAQVNNAITIIEGKTGDDYTMMLRHSATNKILTRKLSAAMVPGTYKTLVLAGTKWLDDSQNELAAPSFGDIFACGLNDKVVKTFSVMNIVPNKNHGAVLTLLEYDAALYAQIDAMTPEIKTIGVQASMRYPMVAELVLAEHIYFDRSGKMIREIRARWAPSTTGSLCQRYKVYYRKALAVETENILDGWSYLGETKVNSMAVAPVDAETSYQVMVIGIDSMGIVAPFYSSYTPVAKITTIGIPSSDLIPLPAVVSGLQVKDNSLDDTFTGRDLVLTWTKQEPLGANLANGGSIGGAPIIYKVTIQTGVGVFPRTVYVSEPTFTYPLADNILDNAGASFKVRVQARDAWGRMSVTDTTIYVTNTIPANTGTVTPEPYEDGVKFSWPMSTDQDLLAYNVRTKIEVGGTWSDWFRVTKNTYSRDLSDTEKADQGWGNATVYIEVKAVDAFGQVSATAAAANAACANLKPAITVGPTVVTGTFTDLTAAIAKLPSGGGAICIKNSDTPYLVDDLIAIPDLNLEIFGESQGGVVIHNHPGRSVLSLPNYTKTFSLRNVTYQSQNVVAGSHRFIERSGDFSDTFQIKISDVVFNLFDDGSYYGDQAISVDGGTGMSSQSSLEVSRCRCNGGAKFVGGQNLGTVHVLNNVINGGVNDCIGVFGKFVYIENNTAQGVKGSGIGIAGGTNAEIVSILNNLFSGTEMNSSGLSVICCTGKRITLGHNRMIYTGITSGTFGISLESCVQATINENLIDFQSALGTLLVGFYLGVGAENCRLTANSVKVDGTGVNAASKGIWLANSPSKNIFTANVIDMVNGTQADIGIDIASGDGNTGNNNLISNAGIEIKDLGTNNTINKIVGEVVADIDGGGF